MRNQLYAVDISENPVIQPVGQASNVPTPKSDQETTQETLETLFVSETPPTSTPASATTSATTSAPASAPSRSYAKYIGIYSALFMMPILLAVGVVVARDGILTDLIAKHTAPQELLNPLAPSQAVNSADQQTAQLTSATTATSYEYELSLAQGFLQKAIKISNASPTQTATEKQQIVEYLNQALLASNRAVALDPNDHRGYTTRARVYMASSVMNPENSTLAQADLDRARVLGATSEAFSNLGSPIDQLPTEQAGTNTQTLVAFPEEKSGEAEASIGSSATPGTSTVYEGLDAIYIVYPKTTSTSTVNLTILGDNHGLQAYVKNKKEGSGFTIGLTGPAPEDMTVSWFVTQE